MDCEVQEYLDGAWGRPKRAWRAAWRVQKPEDAMRPDGFRDMTNQRTLPHYLVHALKRGRDQLIAIIASQGRASSPQLRIGDRDDVPYSWFKKKGSYDGFFRDFHDRKPVLFTFDGVGAWQLAEYQENRSAGWLEFELRREASIAFTVMTGLLARFSLAFIVDAARRMEVETRIRNIETNIAQGNWEPIYEDAGNACDRILHDLIAEKVAKTGLQVPPGKTVASMVLHERIDLLGTAGVIPPSSALAHQLGVARHLTNLRHSGNREKLPFTPTELDAIAAYGALRNLIEARASGKVA